MKTTSELLSVLQVKMDAKRAVKQQISDICSKMMGITISPDVISAKNKVLYIKTSGMCKQEIVYRKADLLRVLEKELSFVFLDIK